MEIFPLLQARLMLLCFLLGLSAGLVFDLWRTVSESIASISRAVSTVIVFIGDIFTVSLMGASVIVLCFYFNKGTFRFFCVLGLAVGLALYFFAFSRIILKVYSWIFKTFLGVLSVILRPILKKIKKIKRNLQIVIYYALKTLAKITFWVYNIYVKKYVAKKSEKGFLVRNKKDGGSYDKANGKKIFR